MAAKGRKISRFPATAMSKQQQILDVASTYFQTFGYNGSSISAMARESGISKESIYRYFKSKNALFLAVIDQELTQYKKKLTHLVANSVSATLHESLVNIAGTLLSLLMNDRQQAVRRLVFNEVRRSPEIGRYYYEIGPALAYENLEKFFSSVREKSEFSPGNLSRYFMALVLHELMLERSCGVRANPTPDEINEIVGPIVDNFLKAYFNGRHYD
jgi:AcrR family transcriptional regulator